MAFDYPASLARFVLRPRRALAIPTGRRGTIPAPPPSAFVRKTTICRGTCLLAQSSLPKFITHFGGTWEKCKEHADRKVWQLLDLRMFFVLSLLIIISPSIRWVSIQQIWAFRVDVGPKCYSQSIRTSWEWSTNSISIDAGMQCPPLISSIIIRVFSSPLCTSYDVPTLTGPGSVHQTVPYHEYVHFTTLKKWEIVLEDG